MRTKNFNATIEPSAVDIYKHITLTKTICDFFHTESNDTKYSNNKNCVDQNVEKYVLHSMHEN